MADELGDRGDEGVFFFVFLGTTMERLVRSLRARRVVGSSTPLISAMALTGMGSVG